MRQQINLYQDQLIDKPQPLSSRHALMVLLLTVVLLALLSGYSYWQGMALNDQLQRVELLQQEHIDRLEELELQYPLRNPSALLLAQLARLEQELDQVKQIYDVVVLQEQGRNQALLVTLEGLASRVHDGVWLRQVKLGRQGHEVELTGRALRPEQIPIYLQWLSDERIFVDLSFSRLRLTRMQEQPGHIDFVFATGGTGER